MLTFENDEKALSELIYQYTINNKIDKLFYSKIWHFQNFNLTCSIGGTSSGIFLENKIINNITLQFVLSAVEKNYIKTIMSTAL